MNIVLNCAKNHLRINYLSNFVITMKWNIVSDLTGNRRIMRLLAWGIIWTLSLEVTTRA